MEICGRAGYQVIIPVRPPNLVPRHGGSRCSDNLANQAASGRPDRMRILSPNQRAAAIRVMGPYWA